MVQLGNFHFGRAETAKPRKPGRTLVGPGTGMRKTCLL